MLVTTTFAPGTVAPFGSRTLTTRPPASCCASTPRQPKAKYSQTAERKPAISPRLKERANISLDSFVRARLQMYLARASETLVLACRVDLSIAGSPIHDLRRDSWRLV